MNGIILLPSLNRVELLKRFFKSYEATDSELPGLLLIDKGDYLSKQAEYQALPLPKNWKLVETAGVSMAEKCNEIWDQFIEKEFVILLNDDHVLETKHWDRVIASQINGTNVIGTNDGWQAPKRICGATAWSCKVLKTIGWMFVPGTKHLFIDTAWEFLAGKSGALRILMDVMVRHDHAFVNGKKDSTHEQVYPQGWENGPDAQAFNAWTQKQAQKDLEKLIALQPKQGLMIATPSHDGSCTLDYALGLTDLAIFLTQHNVYFEMARVVGSSLIPHARNSLVDMFLKSKCQKMLFVDADQGFNKEAVLALFQSNRRIIGGVTPHKRYPINLNFDPLDEERHYFKDHNNKSVEEFQNFINEKADKQSGEIEVAKTGTGFLMIDRSVFELMKDQVEHYKPFDNSDAEPHGEYFKMGAQDGLFRGEDWAFMILAKKLHIPIFISARSLVTHRGHHTWGVG
jgi:hypothetical protein